MKPLPSKEKLIENFSSCINWEDKYSYIIELGEKLPSAPKKIYTEKYLISECQSQVWVMMKLKKNLNNIKLYGDSDSILVKGLLTIIFIIYEKLTLKEVLKFKIHQFFQILSLSKHLTPSRVQGLFFVVQNIKLKTNYFIKNKYTSQKNNICI
ncbi:Cysteine desulfuration protein sufE [Candidatus Westeberhardia cardiocondylae]|uniref:Cysteine desulfuration protein sufE n=1 Tax=Candidatus Westeberhardia cardiocondylae TaxID=1594731 RepID=A0A0H5BWX4_9ENTR|nr:cysteine desulfuration protein SufE [Candidatus Westeberhardia cardiocondylae]CEN32217.1 Cysteine desulfuration protein sufE [Candidatus Westeberhardia cardiocondylae]